MRGLRRRASVLRISLSLLVVIWGGGVTTATMASQPVAVSITTPASPSSVTVGGTLAITVSVTGTGNTAVTWTVSGIRAGAVPNGNSLLGTIPGTSASTTYTAPIAIPGGNNPVTITATSQADNTKFASLTVTINPSSTTPNAITVAGGNATEVNFNLASNSSLTMGLADVGTCGIPNPNDDCVASVTGIQVSKSGAATATCENATCSVWLLGQGLTNSGGSALARGLSVSVTHGSTTDVTVSNVTAMDPINGLTDINFQIVVSGSAPPGNRDIVVKLGNGETQVYAGAIQIVN